MHIFRLALCACTLSLSACSTIVSDFSYTVNIDSSPSKSALHIYNRQGEAVYHGQTPAKVELRSGAGYFKAEDYRINVSKAGYLEKEQQLKASFDSWYLGNVLIASLMGLFIVDPLTGAMWELPPSLTVDLESTPTPILPSAK